MKRRYIIGLVAAVLVIGCLLLLPRPQGKLRLPAGSRAGQVSLGESHGLVLAPNGSLWSWGSEDRGWPILGLGKINMTANLLRIGTETNWTSVSAGGDHNLALKSDGTIWAWGANYRGQLGDGNYGGRRTNGTLDVQNRPVHTVAGTDWALVKAGRVASYALKRDGSLWAWGVNNFGQLGIGSWADSPVPARVGTATNWTQIRAGGVSAAGLQSDGSLWVWGGSPKLGNTTPQSPENYLIPTRISTGTSWVDVSVAFNLWMAVKSDGTLWAWGRNAPLFTGAGPESCEVPVQLGSAADWQSVWSSSNGFYHLLKKRDGSFWVLVAAENNRAMVKLKKLDLPVNVLAADAGGGAVAAITPEGEVWTCGTVFGQLGIQDSFLRFTKRQCERLGWQVSWGNQPKKMFRDQPWQLRCVDRDN